MSWLYFVKGLIIGFSIAAPVGPIGILCIRRTLTGGVLIGVLSGLGAATADAVYGCIAGFGITAVAELLLNQLVALRLLGGAFLCCLGFRIFCSTPAKEAAGIQNRAGLAGAYFSTLALTITNPMTILSFAAVFAGLGLASGGGNAGAAASLVAGVFIGSALWWLTLSSVIGVFRHQFDYQGLKWVNRISGVIVTGFGFAALAGL